VLAMVEILIAYLPALERARVFAIGHGLRPRRKAAWIAGTVRTGKVPMAERIINTIS
jgi:hypothetical protein